MTDRLVITASPVAVGRETAARMLDMSVDSLERYVLPDLKIIRKGKLRLIPVAELERWAIENAELTLDTTATTRAM